VNHDITMEGPGYRLRPIAIEDAATIVDIRLNDRRRNRFINPISPDPKDQETYLESYLDRAGDYYFVIERRATGRPEGLVAIYDQDHEREGWAEWGRWVLLPESPAGPESAWLTYKAGFEALGLNLLYCRTVAANERVVSFHDSCGLARDKLLKNYVTLDGATLDSVEHRLLREAWPDVDRKLAPIAARLARKLS
jgi:RimJ/RimL family protein N-acetyltransferase